ncbi:MAG: hypothetical protein WBE14_08910, partial [Xanthobacteraceae bacterium]
HRRRNREGGQGDPEGQNQARIGSIISLPPMLSKKAKMNRSNFFPVRPSKSVFRNQTRHSALAKVAG